MGIYAKYVLPRLIDAAMGDRPITRQRQKIVPLARGKVLELGMGSGRNLPFYRAEQLEKLYGLEPSEPLRQMTARAAEAAGLQPEVIDGVAEEIPLPANSIDTVLVTYTLCSIAEVEQALTEVKRVLKSSGALLFCEHGRSPDASVSRWQDRLNPIWRRIAGGCNMNRDIPQLLQAQGFKVQQLEQLYLPGPRILRYDSWGSASI